jgi:hypothetical protein
MRYKQVDKFNGGHLLGVGKTVIIGSRLYFYGGCFTNRYCEANFRELGLGGGCPNNCRGNGLCINGICECHGGFYGNECEKIIKCF